MKRNLNDPTEIFDRAVREIRGMALPADEEQAGLDRVRLALSAHTATATPPVPAALAADAKPYLAGCADFQSLMPDYIAARLTPSRTLLLEDHLMECAACWKLFEAGAGVKTVPLERPRAAAVPAPSRRYWKVAAAMAAVLLIAVALTQTALIQNFMWPVDVNAKVEAVDGKVYRIAWKEIRQVARQDHIQFESIRTAAASGAVLELADGSRIEMNERTELNLSRAPDGALITLRRGNIVVSAAKQRNGHLYVKTPDSRVTVVGTVFAVSSGVKGSRVTVLEGEVQVQYDNQTQAVAAGQQVRTSEALPPVEFSSEFAWSRHLQQHLQSLQKFASANQAAAQTLESAALRHTSSLVPLIGDATVLVASLPNVDGSLKQSHVMLEARIAENAVLEQWWLSYRADVETMMEVASRLARNLGPEIIVAAPAAGSGSAPVLLANVTSPGALDAELRGDPEIVAQRVKAGVNAGILALSASASQIQKTFEYQSRPDSTGFRTTALYQRLSKAYSDGVSWLLAADLRSMIQSNPATANELNALGWDNMKEIVIEQKTGREGPAFFQTVGFNTKRTGLTSWLGDPSPMGSLDFVSPSAYTAAGVVTEDPNVILDGIFATLKTFDGSRSLAELDQFQFENNLDIRRDVVAALGNEFLAAIDGPVLPSPSWKVVIEVVDPARLQNALEWSFNELNRRAAIEQAPRWLLSRENRPGETFYKAVQEGSAAEIHYTFLSGYMILAPKRELLDSAVRYFFTGSSLGRSAEFRAQLPADGHSDFSGFVYHNIKSLTNAVPGGLLAGVNVKFPSLVCLYGYPDRIVMSSRGVLGTDLLPVLGLEVLPAAVGRR